MAADAVCSLSGCPVRWEKHRARRHQKESAAKGDLSTIAKSSFSGSVGAFSLKSHVFFFFQILESKEIEALVAEIEKEKEEEAEKKKQKKTT